MKKVIGKKVLILLFLLLFLPLFSCFFLAPMNHAPVITSTPITAATVGELYIYDVEATDSDGDTLTCSLTTCPRYMTIDCETGVINWIPTSIRNKSHDVIVKVSDGELYDTQSFSITVSEAPSINLPTHINNAPVITSTPITIVLVDELYTYNVKATDSDNDILTYSLATNPIGMTIDSVTGEISWAPISSQIGDNDVTVEVSDGEKSTSQSFIITVYDILTSITVLPDNMSLFVGEEHTITSITASYNYGPDRTLTLVDCSYSCNIGGIASVCDGVVTGLAEGPDTITASYTEGTITKTDIIVVTVNPIELTSIIVDPKDMSLFIGEEHTIISITASYNYGPDKAIALADCSYSSDNEVIATVDTGVVTGVADGSATITISYRENGMTENDTIVVTVNPIELTSITVLPETMTLFVGEDDTITSITASYNYGPDKPIALADCSYSSDNETAATVAAGVVTGVGAGSATITVSYTEETITKEDTVVVMVNPIPPNLELLPHTQNAKIGESFSINVEVENALDLLGASITLNFDHVAMPFLSTTPGSFFSNADILADLSGPLGSITLNLVSLVGPASGTGTIMIVSFIAAVKGNNYPITFGVTELRDKDDKIIVHTTGSGCKVHIKKP